MEEHGAHAHNPSSPAVAAMPSTGHAGSHGAQFAWRPTVDTADCRFRGLIAHSLLLGGLAMFVLPHAVAHASRRRIQGSAAAMFLVACFSFALHHACRAPKALAEGNMHAVLGWCFVLAVAAISVALPQPTQAGGGSGARVMTAIDATVSRASAAVLGAPVRLRSWALTVALVLGMLLLLSGIWSTLNCYDSPGFVGYEIGHLVPASMWIGTGVVALCFRRAAAQLDLQRTEGRLMLVLGGLFLAEITMAHHGGMFGTSGGCATAAHPYPPRLRLAKPPRRP